jgi:hypothetical protein
MISHPGEKDQQVAFRIVDSMPAKTSSRVSLNYKHNWLKILIMITVHPQYINDADGQKSLVILTLKEFNSIIEELEELEDIKLYDQAKKEDTGTRMVFSDYMENRIRKNG